MKTGKLLSSVACGLVACCFSTASAQGIAVVSSNGTASNIHYSEIRSIVFSNHNMHVNKTECQDNYFSLPFTSQVLFEEDLGLAENGAANSLSIFPNPASNEIHLAVNDSEAREIEILNIQGTLVSKTVVTGKEGIDVSRLSSGVYFIQVDGTSVKFVKQ